MVGAWGWRKIKAPVEVLSTTGDNLLVCGNAKAMSANVTNRVTAARKSLKFSKLLRARENP